MNYNYIKRRLYTRLLYACCYYYCIKQQGKQKKKKRRKTRNNFIEIGYVRHTWNGKTILFLSMNVHATWRKERDIIMYVQKNESILKER